MTEQQRSILSLIGGVIAIGLGVGLLVCLTITEVTVSLLWPVGATAAAGALAYLYVSTAHTLERERQAREAAARPALQPSAAEMIQELRLGRRIGDRERDAVMDALRTHYTAGRLGKDELDERLAAALTARTPEELHPVLHGLPDERTGR